MFYLMSIHERYAALILSGRKQVEIRRNSVHMLPGDYVAIYATKPIAKIVGYFIVDRVVNQEREEIWKLFEDKACIQREQYVYYTKGKSIISAIIIRQSIRRQGMSLADMDLWIPQSYSRIKEEQFLRICKLDCLPED